MVDFYYIAAVLGVILVSMTVHEAMHAYMGYALGDDTAKAQGRLTLNPLKHIDPFMTLLLPLMLALAGAPIFGGAKPVPFNPQAVRHGEWGAALVALAGPLANLLIAFIAFGVGAITGIIGTGGWSDAGTAGLFIRLTVSVNLGFFVFNMLPIPPLDGSRVLYVLAPESVRRTMELIEQHGMILIFILVLVGSPVLNRVMLVSMDGIVTAFLWLFGVY